MASWRAVLRGAMTRALLVATSLITTPAVACTTMTVQELAGRLPSAARYEAGADLLPPFLLLWRRHRTDVLPARPDGVAVFAAAGEPLLLAYRSGDCLLGLLPTQPDEVWRALREQIGPIA